MGLVKEEMTRINELKQRLAKIIRDEVSLGVGAGAVIKKRKRKRPVEMDELDEILQIDTREDDDIEEGEEDTKGHYKGKAKENLDKAKDILESDEWEDEV
tara:strand:- start:1489 stop:1788 length:300 start_codon:yes stop_codon:yes gene_type:complete